MKDMLGAAAFQGQPIDDGQARSHIFQTEAPPAEAHWTTALVRVLE